MRGKGKSNGKDKPTGCMAFFVSLGRRVNQRLATIRNSLRRKLRTNNNDVRPLGPEELENETGTRDLVFELKPVGPVKAERLRKATSPEPEHVPDRDTVDTCADKTAAHEEQTLTEKTESETDPLKEQVKPYINSIIVNAQAKVKAEAADKDQKESESLTSSTISAIAEDVVSQSLSKLAVSDTIGQDTSNIKEIVSCEKSATSIASSEISQIAEQAVSQSLSKLIVSNIIEQDTSNIRDIVSCDKSATSIASSEISHIAEQAVSQSLSKLTVSNTIAQNTSNIHVSCGKSDTSIASSEISQIAELAVSESLSKVATPGKDNGSALRSTSGNKNTSARRPRSVNEMLEYYGIPPTRYNDGGMPPVDI